MKLTLPVYKKPTPMENFLWAQCASHNASS